VQELYDKIGRPAITNDTFWNVYLRLLEEFRSQRNYPAVAQALVEYQEMSQLVEKEVVEILPGLRELRNGDNIVGPYGDQYIGGQREPAIPPFGDRQPTVVEYASFTDEEESDGSGSSSGEDSD
jgi:hypothetical protein